MCLSTWVLNTLWSTHVRTPNSALIYPSTLTLSPWDCSAVHTLTVPLTFIARQPGFLHHFTLPSRVYLFTLASSLCFFPSVSYVRLITSSSCLRHPALSTLSSFYIGLLSRLLGFHLLRPPSATASCICQLSSTSVLALYVCLLSLTLRVCLLCRPSFPCLLPVSLRQFGLGQP